MAESPRSIARLSLYRRLLAEILAEGSTSVYSHELARRAGVSPAQVRRDIMALGYSGTPNTGYQVEALTASIAAHIEPATAQQLALVGVGNLGTALLQYFRGRQNKLHMAATFDTDPEKVGRTIAGCRCHPVSAIGEVVPAEGISVGIITVPAPYAQETADRLVQAGVSGLLNFAPAPIKAPDQVYVEHMDIAIRLETVAYFALRGRHSPRG